MNLFEIASAFADTMKAQAAAPDSAGSQLLPSVQRLISHPLFIVLLGIAATLFVWWRTKRTQRKQFEEEWKRRIEHEEAQRQAGEEREKKRQREVEETDESRYLEWVISQHRFLPITGLRTRAPVEVELERVYVSLAVDPRSLERMGIEEGKERGQKLRPEDLRGSLPREKQKGVAIADALALMDDDRFPGLVILGGPGTGKTTVLKYLALTYARGLYGERLDQSRPRLPFFVTLREITGDKQNQALADYLTGMCDAVGCKVSPKFFDRKLRDGECIVLLDGLDEVADETQRRQVAKWIEEQCNVYGHGKEGKSKNPFVVTCRVAGFKEEYLPPRFLRLDIEDFDEEDVAQFARNWCLAVETMLQGDSDEARTRGEKAGKDLIEAIQANDRVKELAVNPLMLSIMRRSRPTTG